MRRVFIFKIYLYKKLFRAAPLRGRSLFPIKVIYPNKQITEPALSEDKNFPPAPE